MILQTLVEYYEALAQKGEISRLGWGKEKVSFALELSPQGELLGVIPLVCEEMRGNKMVEVPQVLEVPVHAVKAAGIKANFLCDTANYLTGLDTKGDPDRALKCFECAKETHLKVLRDCDSVLAQAIKAFFETWDPSAAQGHPVLIQYADALMTPNVTFMVNGEYAHEDSEVCKAWEASYTNQTEGLEDKLCFVTGKIAPIPLTHEKIKGVAGAQAVGASLISFNTGNYAYESYGKCDDQCLNAPIGKYAAFAYVTALNHLLADRRHKVQIGDSTVVYWAEGGDQKAQQAVGMCMMPEADDQAELDGLFRNLAAGRPVDGVDLRERFYVLGLSPNAARISVRFFLQNTVGAMLENLRGHYERLKIVKPPFDQRYLSVRMLLWETVNPNSKDKSASPLLAREVMRAILSGTRYPALLYQSVLMRIRAEKKVSSGKAAIIKACLSQRLDEIEREVLTVPLNETTNNRAYVLGRLFAVLEKAQQEANPGINTTIKDRFFTSACATPAMVFPRLLQLAGHHTAKNEKYGKAMEWQIGQLMDKLDVENNPLPTHQSLNEQGLFILGYYQQRQARYAKKEEIKDDSDQQ